MQMGITISNFQLLRSSTGVNNVDSRFSSFEVRRSGVHISLEYGVGVAPKNRLTPHPEKNFSSQYAMPREFQSIDQHFQIFSCSTSVTKQHSKAVLSILDRRSEVDPGVVSESVSNGESH